jgi:hypothetical protein
MYVSLGNSYILTAGDISGSQGLVKGKVKAIPVTGREGP